ncbi:hypothetical protein R3W88_024691 [Solanum pinnatisectum]|uniref:Uncharacterized protein n=1 Tax=Solanum pinnatisectum TaxID=50273 RepID=A0AAV9M1X9_9SOLN|nr:hypothetical protein R3W88_024691 [Solanum pinnatisectum]
MQHNVKCIDRNIHHLPPTVPTSNNSMTDSTELEQTTTLIMKDFMEWSNDMIASGSDDGPPHCFSPLDYAAPMKDSHRMSSYCKSEKHFDFFPWRLFLMAFT